MQPTYFSIIPTKLLLTKELTPFEKLLYADIQSHCNQKGYFWGTNKYLAERHGKDEKHISRAITNLIEKKHLFTLNRPTGRFNKEKRKLFTEATFTEYLNQMGVNIGNFNGDKNITVNGDKNITVLNKNNIKKKNNKRSTKVDHATSVEVARTRVPVRIKKKSEIEKESQNNTSDNSKDSSPSLNSKYKLNPIDHRVYNDAIELGGTKHRAGTKAEIETLEKIHALFSNRCALPYGQGLTDKEYIDYNWEEGEFLDAFEYYLQNSNKPVRSIGKFIFTEGFNGTTPHSPLLTWHKRMEKTTKNIFTEDGEKLYKSLKRTEVPEYLLKKVDMDFLNRVAKKIADISPKYKFVENGKDRTMNYLAGITDVFSKFTKEKLNQNSFKLEMIVGDRFFEEFIEEAIKRNILRKAKAKRENGQIVYY